MKDHKTTHHDIELVFRERDSVNASQLEGDVFLGLSRLMLTHLNHPRNNIYSAHLTCEPCLALGCKGECTSATTHFENRIAWNNLRQAHRFLAQKMLSSEGHFLHVRVIGRYHLFHLTFHELIFIDWFLG